MTNEMNILDGEKAFYIMKEEIDSTIKKSLKKQKYDKYLESIHKDVKETIDVLKTKNLDIKSMAGDLICTSIENGAFYLVEYLIKNGADVNAKNKYGRTALIEATDYNHFYHDGGDFITLPSEEYEEINIEDEYGYGLTFCSIHCDKARHQFIKFLIKNGANVNTQDECGTTALILAVMGEHENIVKILLENGADVNLQDNDGDTALKRSQKLCGRNIASILLEYKNSSTKKIIQRNNPKEIYQILSNIIKSVIEEETCNVANYLDITNLHKKINKQVSPLIKEGLDLNAKDENGVTVMMHARHNKDFITAGYLMSCNVSLLSDSGAYVKFRNEMNNE